MTELTAVGHRLYKRDPQEVVTPAVAEIPAHTAFRTERLTGYYPQRDITSANIGPGVSNGAAGVPLLGPGSFTLVGLKYELLTQTPPAGALVMSMGAGFSLFSNTGGGTPSLGSINNGAGTSLFGGPGAGISIFVGQYGGVPAPAPAVTEPAAAMVFVYVDAMFENVPYRVAAVAGKKAVTRSVGSYGWDAGALSAKSINRYGRAKFRLQFWPNAAVAARVGYDGPGQVGGNTPHDEGHHFVVGFQEGGDPLDPVSTFWGIHSTWGISYDLYRAGFGDEGGVTSGVGNLGRYDIDPDSTYTIESLPGELLISRDDPNIHYEAGFTPPGGWRLNLRASPLLPPLGVVSLSAVIYTPGSWVEGIEVYQYSGVEALLPAIAGSAGDGAIPSGYATTSLPAMTRGGETTLDTVSTTPKMIGAGGAPIAVAHTELPKMTAYGAQAVPPPLMPARNLTTLPALTGRGFSLVGGVGSSTAVLPALIGSGGRPIATGLGTTPGMVGYGSGADPSYVMMYTHLLNTSPIRPYLLIAVVMDSTGAITTAMGIARLEDGALDTAAVLGSSASLTSVLAAIMQTQVLLGADVPLFEQSSQVWTVSLAEDRATSTFENYGFNSFGVIGGKAFGAKADGLFLLEGDTDDGLPIQASVSYGAQDFGTKTDKRMVSAYVGASSTGKLYLKIIAQGTEYLYAARDSSEDIQQQRFDVGRGLAGTYFTFELFNKNGGDFEIDSVTFVAADFKRRI